MVRLASILLVFFPLLLSTQVVAEEDFIELGEKGIQAYQRGDLVTAMGLLDKSARQGYAPAQATLAYLLDKSDFDDQAHHWYEQAALQGNAEGQYGLAGLYANGEGVEKNPDTALRWLLQAVEQKHSMAISMYANAMEFGLLGLQKDAKKALSLYQQCDDAGESSCTLRMSRAYQNGELGLTVDEEKAKALYRKINPPKEPAK